MNMNDIAFAREFAKELEREVPATRHCLERIPFEKFDWKPHAKSMNLGRLWVLVAEIPLWIKHMIENSEIDFATFPHLKPSSTADVVRHFDENVSGAKNALLSVKEDDLDQIFYLKANGQTVFSAPKRINLESTINHMVHHRGQLSVYMRLNDIPVPSIYGPSADDRGF
jgi:uncharacterized damage-inducible protein DinB